jgi:hypothetical protein
MVIVFAELRIEAECVIPVRGRSQAGKLKLRPVKRDIFPNLANLNRLASKGFDSGDNRALKKTCW